jgi:ParB family chromosome partitioning protein
LRERHRAICESINHDLRSLGAQIQQDARSGILTINGDFTAFGVVRLIEHGEDSLVAAVEAERLPVTVAIEIAMGTTHSMQRALSEAYERGELRGARLKAARNLVAKRAAKQQETGRGPRMKREVTKDSLVRDYQQQVREQKALIRKAAMTRDRLLLMSSAMKSLLADELFVTLLHNEGLADMPEQLAQRVR